MRPQRSIFENSFTYAQRASRSKRPHALTPRTHANCPMHVNVDLWRVLCPFGIASPTCADAIPRNVNPTNAFQRCHAAKWNYVAKNMISRHKSPANVMTIGDEPVYKKCSSGSLPLGGEGWGGGRQRVHAWRSAERNARAAMNEVSHRVYLALPPLPSLPSRGGERRFFRGVVRS